MKRKRIMAAAVLVTVLVGVPQVIGIDLRDEPQGGPTAATIPIGQPPSPRAATLTGQPPPSTSHHHLAWLARLTPLQPGWPSRRSVPPKPGFSLPRPMGRRSGTYPDRAARPERRAVRPCA
jgi:hypothetical protein